MSSPGTLRFAEVNTKPSAPPAGYNLIYVKTDDILYLQDSSGTETALGSASVITALTGDVSAIGPGSAVATVNFVGGASAANIAAAVSAYLAATSSNTPNTLVKRDGSGNFIANIITANLSGNATTATTATNFSGSLAGDVTGTQGATVVSFVGTSSAANIHSAELAANAATPSNLSSTIVKRDASGNFSANIITASLSGNATTSTNFTGALSGDVTGTQGATVVSFVGTSSAANIHSAELAANAATNVNTPFTIVKRDGSGNFTASTITANIIGNISGSASSFTGSLSGDVTGTQSATVVSFVGGKTASDVAAATATVDAATASNTASTLVERDASGDFAAGTITADLVGNVTGNVSGTAANVTGVVAIVNGGTNSSTALANNRIMKSLGGQIVEAAAITANRALVSNASGIPIASVTTDTELSYVSGVTSAIQTQINAISGSAITALTGDVTATGPGSVAATIAKIQGTVVSGTTGSVNVVFSNAPTLTGLLSGGSATFTGSISALNLSGTNTGDVTISDTNSIDLTLVGQLLSADLILSTDPADSSNLKATTTIHSGAGKGLHIEYPFDIPVQIGTSNFVGASSAFSLSDHVHAHGNQTSGTLHAAATTSVNGFMSAADKTKLDNADFSTTAAKAKSLEINGTAGAGFIQLDGQSATPSSPPSGDIIIYTNTTNGFNRVREVDNNGGIISLDRDLFEVVYNNSGSTISKGQLVYVNGVFTGGSPNVPTIALARADSPTTSPVFGMAFDTITNNSFGRVFTTGNITGFDTSAFANGNPVYLSSTVAGAMTVTEPLAPNISQLIGYITNAAVSGNIDLSIRAALNTASGSYRSSFQLGPSSGSSEVDLVFANAFKGTLGWNPGSNFSIKLPTTQGAAGTVLETDGTGQLGWASTSSNVDGGNPSSIYLISQFISGGSP